VTSRSVCGRLVRYVQLDLARLWQFPLVEASFARYKQVATSVNSQVSISINIAVAAFWAKALLTLPLHVTPPRRELDRS
jgi:hypothetical protein